MSTDKSPPLKEGGEEGERLPVIALAGNPNVGKSTLFNALTGLRQHTGNWAGKTVATAKGRCLHNGQEYELIDLPGCYSLAARSAEEEAARDFCCFSNPDAVLVVCDATCLERNLILALQTMEITPNVALCINLMDEAKRKGIEIDLEGLSKRLGVPVAGISARSGDGLFSAMEAAIAAMAKKREDTPPPVVYIKAIEDAVALLEPPLQEICKGRIPARWLALRILCADRDLLSAAERFLNCDIEEKVRDKAKEAAALLEERGLPPGGAADCIASCVVLTAEEACIDKVSAPAACLPADRRLDALFTGRFTAFPVMLLLLLLVFFITITGANYPSMLLSSMFTALEEKMLAALQGSSLPAPLYEMLILGVYRVMTWVIAVMLPPMAIFFPLFTLLEDLGYLPRVAFNLDSYFKKCSACGKQALTMCKGQSMLLKKGQAITTDSSN